MPEKEGKEQEVALSREVREVRSYSGPIPPAEEFARYEEVLPGSADRLLSMAEREQGDIVSFRNRVLAVTTIVTIFTIVAIALILTLNTLNAHVLVAAALALAQVIPPITDFLRGISDNRLASKEQELDILIRKDRHELEMKAARQQLSLASSSEDDSNRTPQRLALGNDQPSDKESSN